MEVQLALEFFLKNTLIAKKERVIGFIAKAKNHGKFLNLIHHELSELFDKSKIIKTLPESVLSMSGYLFNPPNKFGASVSTIGEAIDEFDTSFLLISSDGRFAVYGPETFVDERVLYAV